ncbi:hypothetical protein [Hymenobacter jejuensis]|uniref:Uncharacterized protein n=1 Tax=Hymenobacter jejuensis TaxID=2502781 RepID=A0A5B8A0D4_9BACT|nr:hypothetical protein [Hymenobacter jejuensis]QDA60529.1 hypothetical protein FHG12_10595 [Hymenobacter jejuensis]
MGFNKITDGSGAKQEKLFLDSWVYQHSRDAQDGSHLFVAHPFGIPTCRVSALQSPLDSKDVFADLGLDDTVGLQNAVNQFFVLHGGMGREVVPAPGNTFRPYRRQL